MSNNSDNSHKTPAKTSSSVRSSSGEYEDGDPTEQHKEHAPHGVYHRTDALKRLLPWRWMASPARRRSRSRIRICDLFFVILAAAILITILLAMLLLPSSTRQFILYRILGSQQAIASNGQGPIPPPPPDARVSVILMNHNRPRMLQQSTLISTLTSHANIAEILLCHSNPKTMFHHSHPKVRNINAIDANREHGLSLRFRLAATHATSPWVLQIDDDQEITHGALDRLLGEFSTNPRRIVGRYGRTYRDNVWNRARHGYNTRNVLGNVEVVLTKFLVMEQRICRYFAEYAHIIEARSEFFAQSKPKWNGEDIFMSLVANHVYGYDDDHRRRRQEDTTTTRQEFHNYALVLDVWEASDTLKDDDTGEHDVSGNMDRHRPWNVGWTAYWEAYRKAQLHTAYRGQLWDWAKHELAQLERPAVLEPWSLPPRPSGGDDAREGEDSVSEA